MRRICRVGPLRCSPTARPSALGSAPRGRLPSPPPERGLGEAALGSGMPPSRPAALLFDLDGTLVDTVGARIDAWLAVFEEVGLPADRAMIAPLIGSDGRWLAREVARRAGRELDEHDDEAIDRRSGELFDERNRDPRPLPGVRACLGA